MKFKLEINYWYEIIVKYYILIFVIKYIEGGLFVEY